jgi:hypothetical protein
VGDENVRQFPKPVKLTPGMILVPHPRENRLKTAT